MSTNVDKMDWLSMFDQTTPTSQVDITNMKNNRGRARDVIKKRKDRVRKVLIHLNSSNKHVVIIGRFDLRRQTRRTLCKWLKLAGIPDEHVPTENMKLMKDMVKDIRSLVTSDADRYVTGLSGPCEHVFPPNLLVCVDVLNKFVI